MTYLDDAIREFPELKYSFCRFLESQIMLAKLPQRSAGPFACKFTDESNEAIARFINSAVQLWNETHDLQLTPSEVFQIIEGFWHEDIQALRIESMEIEK